jgi:hypothetical protein
MKLPASDGYPTLIYVSGSLPSLLSCCFLLRRLYCSIFLAITWIKNIFSLFSQQLRNENKPREGTQVPRNDTCQYPFLLYHRQGSKGRDVGAVVSHERNDRRFHDETSAGSFFSEVSRQNHDQWSALCTTSKVMPQIQYTPVVPPILAHQTQQC